MIITRENLKEEASNLNDEILNCESCLKKLSGKIAKQLQNEGD